MNSKPSPEADSQKRARAQGQQAYLGHPGQLPLLSLPWATTKYYLLRTESEGSTRGSCNPKEQAQPSRQPATRYSCQKVPPASHPHRKQSGKLRPNGISSASDSCQGFQTYTHTHNHLYSMCVEPPRSLLMKTLSRDIDYPDHFADCRNRRDAKHSDAFSDNQSEQYR